MRKQPDRVLTVYEAEDGFRWHLKYNAKVLAESGESYQRQKAALDGARSNGVGRDFPLILRYLQRFHGGVVDWVEERIR